MASGLGVKKPVGTGFNVLLSLACIVLIVAGLKAASELFVPVTLGLFLAILSLPILNWVHDRGVPRPLAILLTILFDMLIVGGLVFIAIGVISGFQDKKDEYAEILRTQTTELTETVDEQLKKLSGFWERFGVDEGQDPTPATAPEDVQIPTFKEVFEMYWDSNRIVELIGQTELLGKVTSVASKSFFVFVIMIFVLAESGRFSNKLKDVIRVRGPDLRRFQNSSRDIQKYLAIKTGISAGTGLLAWGACMALDIDFPLLWGLVAFVFNYIPAIGSILAAIPPIVLGLLEHGFWPAFAVFLCYLIINIGIGNFLEPMLLGDRFGISTVVVILSVLVWGYIWGPVGMFLAVPLTMMVKVMLDNSPDLRWISVLMGKGSDDRVIADARKFRRVMARKKSEPDDPDSTDSTGDKESKIPTGTEGAAS
ncbi:MAG: AI-2E family transporter [Verrucomicrobiales bacterium]|nr:AI-2E family transporter [Verrucomicrobiales bacterium]